MTAGYYRHPTINGDTIVFVSEDDLWRVEVGGGPAQRLTANPGTESFPVLSPDGESVAFTSRDEGHPEAYVMATEGGPPRRLTFLGVNTQVVGWSPDGEAGAGCQRLATPLPDGPAHPHHPRRGW